MVRENLVESFECLSRNIPEEERAGRTFPEAVKYVVEKLETEIATLKKESEIKCSCGHPAEVLDTWCDQCQSEEESEKRWERMKERHRKRREKEIKEALVKVNENMARWKARKDEREKG